MMLKIVVLDNMDHQMKYVFCYAGVKLDILMACSGFKIYERFIIAHIFEEEKNLKAIVHKHFFDCYNFFFLVHTAFILPVFAVVCRFTYTQITCILGCAAGLYSWKLLGQCI